MPQEILRMPRKLWTIYDDGEVEEMHAMEQHKD
jgi:hypothetical protein